MKYGHIRGGLRREGELNVNILHIVHVAGVKAPGDREGDLCREKAKRGEEYDTLYNCVHVYLILNYFKLLRV